MIFSVFSLNLRIIYLVLYVMKTKGIIAIIAIALIAVCAGFYASAEQPQKQTVVFTVEPKMHCRNCENKIKTTLRFEKGVTDIATDVKTNTVTITYDSRKTDIEKLAAAFNQIGYKANATNPGK